MAIDPDLQLPSGTDTFNERFFDALIRHQIGLLRLSGSMRRRVFELLDATEADLAAKIRRQLSGTSTLDSPAGVRRLQRLLDSIRATRLRSWRQVTDLWVEELVALARAEPAMTDGILKTVSPAVLETTLPSVQQLTGIVRSRPFQGRTLRQWAADVARADLARIEAQIKIGVTQGESSQAIARRVVGTGRLKGRDGVTQLTRRQVEAVTRTAVNAISNQSRREFFRLNAGLFTEELYVATLDSRTTRICSSLDGQTFDVGKGPIPPLHFNCRSLRIAVLDGGAIGKRPARNFTEQGLLREFTDQNNLPRVKARSALPRGFKGTFDEFARARMRQLTGRVPAKVTYGQWLNRQSAQFQDDILGPTRGALFRRGGLKLDRFVNRAGDEIPLGELARRNRQAFIDAGLDPEDFL